MKHALFFILVSVSFAYSQPIAHTKSGDVSGSASGSVHIYKGVPFAEPPVGELRWKEPVPVKPWKGTKVCTAFSASPVQNDPRPFMMWTEEFIAPPKPLSEDCLYLNVWTPQAKEKLPVLVWIYGGGLVSGSSACAVYDGEEMAKQGIVFVSINYRVGVFGFLAHPELSAEAAYKSSGNYGILDQVAALKWIHENIAAFGGDPEKVTIAGQSAGSFSVQALVASPLAKGLFRGAIAQSGALTSRPQMALKDAEKIGVDLGTKANAPSLAALRALPADSVLKIANTFPFGSFSVIVDGYLLPEDVHAIFSKGKHNDVSLMAGWVMGDGNMVATQTAEQFREQVRAHIADTAAINRLFPSATKEQLAASQVKLGLLTFAGHPDVEWALANKHASYVYEYSYVPTDKPGFPNYGAFHTSEVPFALHTLHLWNRPWKDADYAVEKYMSRYWLNFVKTGDPNGGTGEAWRKYDTSDGNIMELGTAPTLKPGLYREEFLNMRK